MPPTFASQLLGCAARGDVAQAHKITYRERGRDRHAHREMRETYTQARRLLRDPFEPTGTEARDEV